MPYELIGSAWTEGTRGAGAASVAELEAAAGREVPSRIRLDGSSAVIEAWVWNERLLSAAEGNDALARATRELVARLQRAAQGGLLRSELDVTDIVLRERLVRGAADVEEATLRFVYRERVAEVVARLGLTGRPGTVILDAETGEMALIAHWPELGDGRFARLAESQLVIPGSGQSSTAVELEVVNADGALEGAITHELPFAIGDPIELARAATEPLTAGLNPESGLPFLIQRLEDGARCIHDYLVHTADVDPALIDGFAPLELSGPRRDWREALACPGCRRDLDWDERELRCVCGERYPVKRGVPHFLHGDGAPELGPGEEWLPNVLPKALLYFLAKNPGGLVLDCGSGNGAFVAGNLVNLEIFPFASTTVVGDGQRLPFRDGTFDGVLSAAVLEHVPDPPAYCAELRRVLRTGGELRIDSAFLQPYHACPDHYYNTSLSGLAQAARGFRPVGRGVGPHQSPFVALQVWLNTYARLLGSEEKKARLFSMTVGELLAQPPGIGPPDLRIPPLDWAPVASGVYLHGVKVEDPRGR